MTSLPIGWESRSNRMSEKDMKLGGIAATKFIDKRLSNNNNNNADGGGGGGGGVADGHNDVTSGSNAYSGSSSGIYQNSDQVRDHYLRQIEHQQQQQQQQQKSANGD
eukprot:CAMPEP_0197181178 /NCGR_PEP_ID=MMETSP1423-20130617/5535_1 /TAXON_ID=476441 /ORGANISM="Pseudo-nitzschia heimii, Strain UNC1101" /LENGTH=106 /DNA_ID=CAMNT_0042631373 /DNA_START=31 /DNA_END=348 /DNA_ORIENTATION=+